MAIKVLLADDHPIVRSGVRNELARHSDIVVVAEALNGDETLRLAQAFQPDVLLLDINMPGLKTIQIVRTLRASLTPPKILILTAYGDLETILGMLKAGVAGYLLKDEDPSVITQGVREVAQGRTWLSAGVAKSLVGHTVDREEQRAPDVLSEREREVLRSIALGYSNQRIAETLAISEGTVKNHVTSIYDKLKVHSRAEAVVWAWQRGLVHGL
ncbi:MAG TPA: response regulator transcription factor [Anaerolineae bacterium]|nr:response regulator transcription factor [Anaerolineae bacterium]